MLDETKDTIPLNARQRLAVKLILFALSIIHPWEYDHQAQVFIDQIKSELNA